MRHCLQFICTTVLLLSSLSSRADIDSLLNVWNDTTKHDSIRLKALGQICGPKGYIFTKPDSSIYYSRIGYEHATEEGFNIGSRVSFLVYNGVAHHILGQYTDALRVFEKADSLAIESELEEIRIPVHSGLANTYLAIGRYSEAIEKYYRVLSVHERINNEEAVIRTHLNLGIVYDKVEDYDKAMEFFTTHLNYNERTNNERGLIEGLQNLAIVNFKRGNYQEALKYYSRLIPLLRSGGYARLAPALQGLGDVYFEQDSFHLAEKCYREALSRTSSRRDVATYAITELSLAQLFRDSKQDSALIWAEHAFDLFANSRSYEFQVNTSRLLAELYEEKGIQQRALQMLKFYNKGQDSIRGDITQRALYKNQVQYQYEKEKLLSQIKFEQELAQKRITSRVRISLMAGGIFVIVILLVSIIIVRNKKNQYELVSLLAEVDSLKKRLIAGSQSPQSIHQVHLKKESIEAKLNLSISTSRWKILNALLINPMISNEALSHETALSLDEVRAGLREMYTEFRIQSNNRQNKKVALLRKALQLSTPIEREN